MSSTAAPTKMFYYLSVVSASAHVKQAVLLTAFDEAHYYVTQKSMVIGCVRLNDVTVTIRHDTEVAKNWGLGPFLCGAYMPEKMTLSQGK